MLYLLNTFDTNSKFDLEKKNFFRNVTLSSTAQRALRSIPKVELQLRKSDTQIFCLGGTQVFDPGGATESNVSMPSHLKDAHISTFSRGMSCPTTHNFALHSLDSQIKGQSSFVQWSKKQKCFIRQKLWISILDLNLMIDFFSNVTLPSMTQVALKSFKWVALPQGALRSLIQVALVN